MFLCGEIVASEVHVATQTKRATNPATAPTTVAPALAAAAVPAAPMPAIPVDVKTEIADPAATAPPFARAVADIQDAA